MISTSNPRPVRQLIAQWDGVAGRGLPARGAQRLDEIVVLEDVEGLLECRKVVGADQDEGGSSVAGDQDAVVFALDPVGNLRQVGLDFGERKRLAHRSRF